MFIMSHDWHAPAGKLPGRPHDLPAYVFPGHCGTILRIVAAVNVVSRKQILRDFPKPRFGESCHRAAELPAATLSLFRRQSKALETP